MQVETYTPSAERDVEGAQLALLARGLSRRAYEGYPELRDRFFAEPNLLPTTPDGRLILPDGPWNVDTHADQPLKELAPSPARQQELLDQGYILDSKGRPLHPWFLRMVADPAIGVVLGKGVNWEWGMIQTVDAIVKKGDYRLLIRRTDTGEWAWPGGYANARESVLAGAMREAYEETGLVIPETARAIQVYDGPVADIRLTAHAGNKTTAFLFELDPEGPLPAVKGSDDAAEARWFHVDELRSGQVPLFGSHDFLFAEADEALAALPAPEHIGRSIGAAAIGERTDDGDVF